VSPSTPGSLPMRATRPLTAFPRANVHTVSANRKTISPADVLQGLKDTEFGAMIPRLEAELAKYNEVVTAKRSEYRKKVRESIGTDKAKEPGAGDEIAMGEGADEDRAAKKPRLEGDEDVSMAAGAGEEDVHEDGEADEHEEEGEEESEEDDAEPEPEPEPEPADEEDAVGSPAERRDDESAEESD
jgi:DNA polymerase epsilon subunit 3